MNPNDTVLLCDSLAIIILARLLKRNGTYVMLEDLKAVEKNIADGITTYVEAVSSNTITIRGLTSREASIHTQTMLPYINTNEKLKIIADKLELGNQMVDIRVENNKVVCSYITSNQTVQDISFTVIPNKANTNVYGVGYKTQDYGFSIHKDYMSKLFGLQLGKDEYHDYISIAGDGTITATMKASKALFEHCAKLINEQMENANTDAYFMFFNRLLNALHGSNYPVEDEFEVIKQITGEIVSLNYQTLFSVLKLVKINVRVGDNTKLPIFIIEDDLRKNVIFKIRIRREISEATPQGKKYKIYLEPGGLLNLIMNNQLENV